MDLINSIKKEHYWSRFIETFHIFLWKISMRDLSKLSTTAVDLYEKIGMWDLSKLSTTAVDLFDLFNKVGKLCNFEDEATVCLIGNQLQESETYTVVFVNCIFTKTCFNHYLQVK